MKDLSHIDINQNISDFADIIEDDYIEKIDRHIRIIEEKTTDEVALELFNKFGIGKKDDNNGILLLISRDDNQFRIEIGIGLEKVLSDRFNDDLASRVIAPGFKNKKMGRSVLKFVKKIHSKIKEKGFTNFSLVSLLSGILSVVFGLSGIFSSSILALNSNLDLGSFSSILLLFAKTSVPAIILALAAVVFGTLDLIREEEYLGRETYSSRSITGIILGVGTVVLMTVIFFIFPAFTKFLAKVFLLSSGTY